MKKKIVLCIVLAGLIFGLAGCAEEAGQPEAGVQQENSAVSEEEFAGDGAWTILVYLCGTDLESGYGAATMDLGEMLDRDFGSQVRFVVQTGGCTQWQNEVIPEDAIARYEIINGDMQEISRMEQANMAESATLKDFVTFGVENYGNNKLGLIMWDHGGGSVAGVCLDENYGSDTLDLAEIQQALDGIPRKFNFIGYDACLMGSVENAKMLSPFANYMIGSEELESGGGWDYAAIGAYLQENPGAPAADLGKEICDSFYKSCEALGEESTATLSVTDLSKIQKVCDEFGTVAESMKGSTENMETFGEIAKGIRKAQNYGGNTPSEGYSNMVDLGDMAKNIAGAVDTSALQAAISEAVIYQVKGANRRNANGLSVYYPLQIEDEGELKTFETVCVSDSYTDFIGTMVYGAANGSIEEYSGENDWSAADQSGHGLGLMTADQNQIQIAEEQHLNDDGYYTFTIAQESLPNVASVQYNLYMKFDDETPLVYLGSDNWLDYDDQTGVVTDTFQGYWPALPDGSLLSMYVVEESEDYTIFSSPIVLNGQETNLRFAYLYGETEDDGEWMVLGAWDGIDDESGQADKEMTEIKKGDVIRPIYVVVDQESGDTTEIKGDKYRVGKKFNITEPKLPEGEYYYSFGIDDLFGSTKYLDLISFWVNKKGKVELSY